MEAALNLNPSNSNNQKIWITTSNEIYVVRCHQIVRLEAEKNYTTFYFTDRRPLITCRHLKLFENILPTDLFFRIHKTHLINLNHISHIMKKDGGHVQMLDNSVVPISRYKKQRLYKIQMKTALRIK